ncbi:hypothetical protein ABEB36_002782 [Hypothenemus hampei]|uniref:RING-type E3 ubiquitin transferase n=1 Tax=Hypothenemus hampei TaxID=57062 RepID=A0ABD1F6Z3_HYPHA
MSVKCHLSIVRTQNIFQRFLRFYINMAGKKSKNNKVVQKPDFKKLNLSGIVCPVCRTILTEPVTLPCDHTFCKPCFEGSMEKANLVCPLCRLRVGSWYRRAKKVGKIIDEEFWNAIQQQYPVEVRNKSQGIDNDIEQDEIAIKVADPGEIRQEYEKEKQKDLEERRKLMEAEEKASVALIKQLRQEEEYKRRMEEERLRMDAHLAKKLATELNSPSTSKGVQRKMIKSTGNMKFGPIDRFIKIENITKPNHFSTLKRSTSSSRKISSTSPKSKNIFFDKEYTCHFLPIEHQSTSRHRDTSLFADFECKGIFPSGSKSLYLNQRLTCTSGYKSSGSGDNSDVIDQECKFYFKPIDLNRRYHVPGKIPLKIAALRGASQEHSTIVQPPAGKTCKFLYSTLSAFAKVNEKVKENESIQEISEDELPRTNKNLKRKISGDNNQVENKKLRVDSPSHICKGFDLHSFKESENTIKRVKLLILKLKQSFDVSTKRKTSPEEPHVQATIIDVNRNIPKLESNPTETTAKKYNGSIVTSNGCDVSIKNLFMEKHMNLSLNIENQLVQINTDLDTKKSSDASVSPVIGKSDTMNIEKIKPNEGRSKRNHHKNNVQLENGLNQIKTDTTFNDNQLNSTVPSLRITRNSTFKPLNSPSKANKRLKSSPDKSNFNPNILVSSEVDLEQRKIQEEADFVLAKRLQAQFDLIQMSPRTRRGTKRQITLDEMLAA